MYSVSGYGRMITDALRMEAYVGALRKAVKPGSVVLDLGSGPGLFALLCCQLGARLVYAVEPDDVIQLARKAAVANGFADRILFFQDFSTRVNLPEACDVIVSDLRGVLPWFQQHIPSIRDARSRFLAPGGVLIPQRDSMWAALVEAPVEYDDLVGPWQDNPYHLELTHARQLVTNTWQKIRVTPKQLLVEPTCWHVLDYRQVASADVKAEIAWSATRPGTSHGLVIWFDTELLSGIGFSNRAGNQKLIYGNAFFPFSYPIELALGDKIAVTLSANLVGEDYVWRWNTRVVSKQNSGFVKASFQQSSFFGVPLSLARLHKQSASHVPLLNDEGRIEQFILSMIDGKTALEEIAHQLSLRFPDRFTNQTEALTLAGEVSLKYSQ
jgi:type I protein arginine methyltransferase